MSGPKNPDNGAAAARGPNGAERQAGGDASAASIDKVRDILFGGQVREFDRRFARLEERLLKETNDLKDHLKARLEALEKFTKKETESLADKIKSEHEDRIDAHSTLTKELKDATKAFEKRTASLDDQQTKSQRELRQQILEQGQKLSEELRKRVDDVLARLASEAQVLRNDKADRATIAALLTEMALRLSGEELADDAKRTRPRG
jgi:DNA anti-recombination protein RmuC